LIDDLGYGFQMVNVAAQQADPDSFWHALRRLIGLRKSLPVLSHGKAEFLDLGNKAVLGVTRSMGGEKILALHNLSPQAQALDASGVGLGLARVLIGLGGQAVVDTRQPLTLAPFGYVWLRAEA
jgi:maltose alpha-D-glucosyltransferase/alpha-amylase